MKKAWIVIVACVCLLSVVLATKSVVEFAGSKRQIKIHEMPDAGTVVRDPYRPATREWSHEEIRTIEAELRGAIRLALGQIAPSTRPNEQDQADIARVVAEFITVCRTGEPEDYVSMTESRGRTPLSRFSDPDHKDGFWKTNTGWAREGALDPAGITARPRAIRGREIPPEPDAYRPGPSQMRALSTTKQPWMLAPHDRTLYEIIIPTTLASVSGTKVEGAVGIAVANDGPASSWDVVMISVLDVPHGFAIFLTPP